ncbi:hypothetical protein D9599_26905 [Roseomonas sp. KE2513]|uniref:metallophosphoesterase n=1 Tax=Roseomonas sp. KE2513 TaxID=2479202 RepID=UPI0018E01D73|nr:metallophosphoesterase [Roseomonas sp. KE2513]MBI0539171.1 hypothetical protein [Roseomonas sp. KE2513]
MSDRPEPSAAPIPGEQVPGEPGLAPAAPEPDLGAPPLPESPAVAAESTALPVPPEAAPEPAPAAPAEIPIPEPRDLHDLDWEAIRRMVDPAALRARMRQTVEAIEGLLDRAGGPGLLFDDDRAGPGDRAIQVKTVDPAVPLWIIGDLHGDLLALEAALAAIARETTESGAERPRIVFLGDLFDDEGYGLEVLLRVFELILEGPERTCVIAGNHDEALSYDGIRFASSVSPADFADLLNAHLSHEWMERAGKAAVRFFATAPRALFLPDGLLVAHAGFPLADLHERLAAGGDWNDPACLSDFTWTRAHPTARRKLPNRFSRGSQFGYQDFAAFCELSARLGRPVTHLVRGHDHVEERFAIPPAYRAHPVLTTVALSRRLPREAFGPRERVPTLARFVERSVPQVYRLHIPAALIDAIFLEPLAEGAGEPPSPEAQR